MSDFYDSDEGGDFEVIDAVRPLCVSVNQTGTRIAVGHERGFLVYAVAHESMPSPSSASQLDNTASGSSSDRVHTAAAAAAAAGVATTSSASSMDASTSSSSGAPYLKEVFQFDSTTSGGASSGQQHGVGHVALLYETLHFAIVGGGARPLLPLNRVRLMSGSVAMTTIVMPDAVRNVVLAPNKVLILTETRFAVTSFRGDDLMEPIPARGGPLSASPGPLVVAAVGSLCAMPGPAPGSVQVVDIDVLKVVATFHAHSNPVSCIALNSHGTVMATASQRGTLFRVWDIAAATAGAEPGKVAEVRNASWATAVRHLRVADTDHILCLCGKSLKVFYVGKREEFRAYHAITKDPAKEPAKNTSSYFSSTLGYVSEYFNSEWPCAELSVPPEMTASLEARCQVLLQRGQQQQQQQQQLAPASAESGATAASSAALGAVWSLGSWVGLGGGGATTASSAQPPSTAAAKVTHYNPTALDDHLLCWWENAAVRMLESKSSAPPAGGDGAGAAAGTSPLTDPMRSTFFVATTEGCLASYEFNIRAGTAKLLTKRDPK